MMHPKDISITDYRYHLPSELIAHYPLAERDASKLLIYKDGEIREDIYRRIGAHIPEHSLLVFNNTKVVEARIVFHKPTGSKIEIFCLEPPPEYGDITTAMLQTGKVRWKCLIGGASKWKAGQVLIKSIRWETPGDGDEDPKIDANGGGATDGSKAADDGRADKETGRGRQNVDLQVRYIDKLEDAFLLEFSWTPAGLTFAELLHRAGLIPLPPYIRRAAEPTDSERYQTIYARHDGSVAAPTAGLHFTPAIFAALADRRIQQTFVTLHVGAGTFLPVKVATMEQHRMHIEFIDVSRDTVAELSDALRRGRLIIPVGTTSARTIESLYWLGAKTARDPGIDPKELVVRQWDAYGYGGLEAETGVNLNAGRLSVGMRGRDAEGGKLNIEREREDPQPQQALEALLDWMERRMLTRLVTTTQLLITPGYDWKIAGALITNFHQPESTLLLLVASLIGKDWKKVYEHALEQGFRFLSYGDGCLLFPGGGPKRG